MFPELKTRLLSADIPDTPEQFVKKTLMLAFYGSAAMSLIFYVILREFIDISVGFIVAPPLLFIMMFMYFMRLPAVKAIKKEREINQEIVYAVRFMIIEIESGVSLYDSMIAIGKNYETLGKYFTEIVDRIDLGTPLETSIEQSIEITSSHHFRQVLWQIVNSLRTGSDVAASLNSTVDQIAEEQLIEVKEYGRKLNPLAMFYMMVAVIIPSIGMVMVVMLSSFLALSLGLSILLTVAGMIGFIQFMFYSIIKSSRPAIDL